MALKVVDNWENSRMAMPRLVELGKAVSQDPRRWVTAAERIIKRLRVKNWGESKNYCKYERFNIKREI